MKNAFLFFASLLLGGTMFAKQLSPDEALSLAMGRLNGSQSLSARSLASGASTSRLTLEHTGLNNVNVPLYYVYGISEGGFFIASADDRAMSLLGYTDSGDFETARQNPAFMSWLTDCIGALNWLSEQPEGSLEAVSAATRGSILTPVAPLLGDIKWNQGAPYNNMTPMRVNSQKKEVHAPTGCVATAVAQVMMYHQWPIHGTGTHTNAKDSSQIVNFAESTYNWAVMKTKYGKDDAGEAADAVAKLMFDVGCAIDMNYGGNESGANDFGLIEGLAFYLGYNKGLSRQNRLNHSTDEWNRIIRSDLDNNLPVIFGGAASSGGGHQFVLDGYDANGMYHVNWGWGGMANGYFDINVLDPDFQGIGGYAGGYVMAQSAIIGVKPDKDNSTIYKPQLEIVSEMRYKSETNQFTYQVNNWGLGAFTGEVGYIHEYPDGTTIKEYVIDCSDNPLKSFDYGTVVFDAPAITEKGHIVYPYYCETKGGEIKSIPTPVSAITRWGSYYESDSQEWTWGYWTNERANLSFSNLVATRHYAGFNPKFKVQVAKPDADRNEFNNEVVVTVYKTVLGKEEVICKGFTQLFINPGEEKEIEVECNLDSENNGFDGNIKAGEYHVKLQYRCAGYIYTINNLTKTVKITTPATSHLTYSDFVVDQANGKIAQGEVLSASMTVKNTGGFDMKEFVVFVYPYPEGGYNVESLSVRPELHERASTTVYFNKYINLDPGKYFCGFYIPKSGGGYEKLTTERFVFEVTEASTAIDEIQNAADAQPSQLFDLSGRPVTELKKGGFYIGKSKIIVR